MSKITSVRVFEEADYPIVLEWWVAHGWPGVPIQMLPKLGVIMSTDEKDICAGWVYMDNSVGVCMMEWIVSNPDATARESYAGIKEMTGFLERECRRMDYGVMLTTCKQDSLVKVHEKNGFQRTDSGMNHLIKFLNKEGE